MRIPQTRPPLFRFLLAAACFATLLAAPALSAAGTDVLRETLANGLRVIVVPDPVAPVVTTEMNYLVGSNESPDGFPGTAHALEHMMFRGSPGLSADQLNAILAGLGGESNASTSQTVTRYYLTVPADALDIALRIEAIRMRGVLSTEKLWEKERGAIEQEVASDLSNPEYLFYTRLLERIFDGTPYAHDALGTRPSFQRTTGAMLRKFHEEWYAPNNAVLVIAGDVDPVRALAIVKREFGAIRSRPVPPRPKISLKPLEPLSIAMDTDLPYGLAVVAWRLPGFWSPDYAAGQVLADALESRRGNLYSMVAKGEALSFDLEGIALPGSAIGYAVAAFPKGGDGQRLVGRMKEVVDAYLRDGIPAELVEASKRHEVADAQFRKNSVAGLASSWSDAVAEEGRESPDDDIEAIRRVTPEEVNRVARKYLVNDNAVVAVLAPRPSGKPAAAEGYGGRESFAPTRTRGVKLPAWAKKAGELPPVPALGANPTVAVLPNGLRLIVQPESVSPTVTVLGEVKTNPDLQEPRGKEGVASVLESLFPYGTATMDRLAFQAALDNIDATASVGAEFSLQVLSDRFEQGMRLLAENLLQPALPEEAFRIVRKENAAALAGEIHSPAYLSRRALRKGLYPAGDPALREALPETVQALSLSDVKAYYSAVFRPDMTTVVVIGQVSPEAARAVVEKYFGGWKAVGPKPVTDPPPVPDNPSSATVVPDDSRVQDEVRLAQTVAITRTDPDYYALQLGNHVLTGGFYATRLYRDLREQTGLVYNVESLLEAGKTRSLFAVFYASDPPNVFGAKALVERNLRAMATSPVTPAELRQAKTLLLRRIPLAASSLDRIAQGLLHRSVADLPLDEPVRAARMYLRLTAADVRDAFARRIRPDGFVQVTTGPPPR
jgi:zinc protease